MTIPKPNSQPGCTWITEHIEHCMGTSVYVEDHGVRATFVNARQKTVRKIHYDGCYAARKDLKQADFIVGPVGELDVIVELKGSDTNLSGNRGAEGQLEYTLDAWREDANRSPRIAGLIIYGRIEGKKKGAGRVPRAEAVMSGMRARFLKRHRILVLIHENGERQFQFNDFLRTNDAG
jgi:hypothetical protein